MKINTKNNQFYFLICFVNNFYIFNLFHIFFDYTLDQFIN